MSKTDKKGQKTSFDPYPVRFDPYPRPVVRQFLWSRTDDRCSFCGKQQDQVERLTTGPGGVSICNECVDLCRKIIEEKGTISLLGTESPFFLLCDSCEARCRRTDHYCFNCGQKLEQEA